MSTLTNDKITIVGAGLVGSLLSIFLAKKGYTVQVIEKRTDPRTAMGRAEGRSINLALSHRGLNALAKANDSLPKKVLAEAVPMYGRQMHGEDGNLSYQAYSSENQCIYSVSRARLNITLIDEAEQHGVIFLFDHTIERADLKSKCLQVNHAGNYMSLCIPVLFAADGAFSVIRASMEEQGVCVSTLDRIEHGYKELDISPERGRFLGNKEALHIWPRGQYMFIALPNYDHSYTGTLFLPFKGEPLSFEKIKEEKEISTFFRSHFPDTLDLFEDLAKQYTQNPTSFLGNVYTDHWFVDQWLLIGDAAHGIVPFYGQGMNAGFEDCSVLEELMETYGNDWSKVFPAFEQSRKKNTDAIAQLALENFIEMRDLVSDKKFLLQKKIEQALSKAFPNEWKSLYNEVSFSDTPYSEALARGKHNQYIMDQIMGDKSIDLQKWQEGKIWGEIIKKIRLLMNAE